MDIAVCDDNLSDREIIRQQLSIYFSDKFIEYNVDSYENGVNLIYSIDDGEYYDRIFLDMYMDKLNGIQVAEKLRNMNYKGKIIFLTVTSKYAVESYDVEASGYLVKPHDIDKISMVLDRVLSNYENVHTYQIKKRNSVIQVLYSEIEYIESSNSKCILHRTDGNEYTIYKKLNDIEEEINHRAFLRCHQSYLVNMNKIESVENDFTMKSGDIVPIRTRNLNEIKKEYYNYIEYRGNIAGTTKRLKIFYDKVGGDFEVVKRRLIDEKYVVRFVQCFKNDTAFNELKKALNEELYEKAYLCAHTLKGSSVSLDFGKLYKASSALTETLYNINHNGEDCDKILIDKQFGEVAKEYKNVINSMQIIEED